MNNNSKILKQTGVILPLILLATSASAKTFEREVTRQFTAKPGQRLVIEIGAGSIDVRSGDPGEAIIQVLMSARAGDTEEADSILDSTTVEFSEDSDSLKTVVRSKNSSWKSLFSRSKKSPDVRVVAVCPPEFDLLLDSGSGNISVKNVSGKLIIDTGSGSVSGNNLSGPISVDTGSGSISLADISGSVQADTGSGSIHVHGLAGSFVGDTGSGNIEVRGAISKFFADTGSGSVIIFSSVIEPEPSSANTGSGNVQIHLPASVNASFHAESNSGSIHADFPNAITVASSEESLQLTLNQGGATISANTGSGNISLKPVD